MVQELDRLNKRIVAALQVDGRASWARVAEVLGEPERTVARRGAVLLQERHIRVRALLNPRRQKGAEQFVLKVSCTSGATGLAGASLARRPETLFTYVLTGSADCAAEISSPTTDFAQFLLGDIGSVPGVASSSTYPVLAHLVTMHQWNPGILTAEEVDALQGDAFVHAPTQAQSAPSLTKEERQLLKTLALDGRATFDELSRITGLSVQTVQRRLEKLRREGTVFIRTVFEPQLLGLGVEVLLWVKVPFPELEALGPRIMASPAVRYAAVLAGDFQLVINAVFRNRQELYEYLKSSDWISSTQSIEPSLVVSALKRSGTLALSFGDDGYE